MLQLLIQRHPFPLTTAIFGFLYLCFSKKKRNVFTAININKYRTQEVREHSNIFDRCAICFELVVVEIKTMHIICLKLKTRFI